jgi:hypothetical protein
VLRVGLVAACAVVGMTSTVALAGSSDPGAAEALFRTGRERAAAGDWASACPMFVESNRLEFALGTTMNLAACEEHVGKLASAWQRYRELLDSLSPGDERRPFVAESVDRLGRAVPKLTVLLAASSIDVATVTRDGIDLGAASIGADFPVDPGEHAIVVAAPGRMTRRYVVTLAAAQRLTLYADMGEPTLQPGGPRRSGAWTAGWIVGGVGVGAMAVGSVLGGLALSERSASDGLCAMGVCRNQQGLDEYNGAKSAALGSDVALAVGAVSLALGAYLLVTSMTASHAPPVGASFHLTRVGFSW